MARVYIFSEEQKKIRRARALAWNKANKLRVNQNHRLYYIKNKELLSLKSICKRKKNAEKLKLASKKWRVEHPWYDSWQGARQRCTNPKLARWARYGGRGIKFLLSKADVQFLWNRDKAYQLVSPSLDRINNDGDYSIDNCQFISRSRNSSKKSSRGWETLYAQSDSMAQITNP